MIVNIIYRYICLIYIYYCINYKSLKNVKCFELYFKYLRENGDVNIVHVLCKRYSICTIMKKTGSFNFVKLCKSLIRNELNVIESTETL